MNAPCCPFEVQTSAAVRTGSWTESLRRHAAECPQCAETMLVAGALLAVAHSDVPPPPEPGLVWWKAQLRLRREARERMERPMRIFDRIVPVAGMIATAFAAAWFADAPPALLAAAGIGFAVLIGAAASAFWFAARHH